MNDLISLVVVDHEPRVDSRLIAKQLGVENKNTRQLVEQYKTDFEEFGQLPFQTEVGKRKQGGGNPEKFALLNEDQSYLLLTYTQNTEQARDLKKRLVRAFGEQRRAIALPAVPTLPVLEASLVLAFNGIPIRFLIDETGHWQATYRDVATALGYLTKEAQYNARNVLKFTVKPGERQLRHPLYGDLISLAGLERVLLRAEHYRATAPDRAEAALALGHWLAEVAAPLVARPAAAGALLSSQQRLDERRLTLTDDPDYRQTACLLRLWHEALGETAYTAAEVLRLATGTFQEALIEIGRDRWFSDQLNAKRLGKWLAVRQGQPVGAFQLDSGVKSSGKVRWWAVLALGGDSP